MEETLVMTLYALNENNERKQIATLAIADDGAPNVEERALPAPLPVGCEASVMRCPLVGPDGARVLFGRALATAIPTYDQGRAADNELARTVRNQGRAIERIEGLLLQLVGRTDADRPAPSQRFRDVVIGEHRVKVVERLEPGRGRPLDQADTVDDVPVARGRVPASIANARGRVPASIANEQIAQLAAGGQIDWAKIEREAQGGRQAIEPIPVDFSREAPGADKHAPMERRAGAGLDNVRDTSMNVGNPKSSIVKIGPDGEHEVKLPTYGESMPQKSDIR